MSNELISRSQELGLAKLTEAQNAQAFVDAQVIDTPKMYEWAAKTLRDIKTAQKNVKAVKDDLQASAKELIEKINKHFGPPLEQYTRIEATLKSKILAYHTLAAEREQAKLQAAVVASHAGNTAQAVALIASTQDDSVQAAGISTRDVYKFKVTNEALVPREYLMVDVGAIGKEVRGLKGQVEIPGVRVWVEKSLTARGAA